MKHTDELILYTLISSEQSGHGLLHESFLSFCVVAMTTGLICVSVFCEEQKK